MITMRIIAFLFIGLLFTFTACASPATLPTQTQQAPTSPPKTTPAPTQTPTQTPTAITTEELVTKSSRDICLDAYDMPALSYNFVNGHEVSYTDTLSAYETDFNADLGSILPFLGSLNLANLKNIVYVFNSVEKAKKEYNSLLSKCTPTLYSYGEECFVDTSKVPWTAVIRTKNVIGIIRTDYEDENSLKEILAILDFKMR